MTHVSLLEPGDAAWDAILEVTRHDFYHRPGYVELCARQERAQARALYVDDGQHRLLLPLRSATDWMRPLRTATRPRVNHATAAEALRAGVDHLHDLGIVSVFVRLHPILVRTRQPAPGRSCSTARPSAST